MPLPIFLMKAFNIGGFGPNILKKAMITYRKNLLLPRYLKQKWFAEEADSAPPCSDSGDAGGLRHSDQPWGKRG